MSERHSVAKRVFQSSGKVLGGRAGAGLISLAYLIVAARALGPRDYGVLVLLHGYVTAICGIVEFPSWQAILRYGAEAQREGQQHRLVRLLRFGAKVELLGGVVAILVAMAAVPLLGPRLGWSPEVMFWAIPYSFAVLASVRSTPAAYLQLHSYFNLIALHALVSPLIRLVGAVIALMAGLGLVGFIWAWLAAALAEFLVLWAMGFWKAHQALGSTLFSPEPGSPVQENAGIWRFLIANNADVTLSDLASRLAPLIVGWVLGPAMAGIFSVAQRGVVAISQPAQVLGNTAYSEWAKLVAAGQGGAPLRRALTHVIGWAMMGAIPIVILVAIFSQEIVILLAGKAYLAAAPLMIVLVFARMLSLATPACSTALSAMGRPGWSMSANLFASIVFLPALPFLLNNFGLAGAGLQAVGQALIASSLLIFLAWRRSMTQ